jgi:hypothetical protein
MSDQLNDFIAAQHQTNIHLSEGMARTEQMLKDMNARLFGGDGQQGALPFIMQEAKIAAQEHSDRFTKIEKRTGKLEGWKKSSLAWVAGAVAVLTLEGSALARYFQHIASKLPH